MPLFNCASYLPCQRERAESKRVGRSIEEESVVTAGKGVVAVLK